MKIYIHRKLSMQVFVTIPFSSLPKTGINLMSFDGWMGKEMVVQLYNGVLLCNLKEKISDIKLTIWSDLKKIILSKEARVSPDQIVQLVGALPDKQTGCWFDSLWGRIQEATDQCFSLTSLSLSLFLSLSLYLCLSREKAYKSTGTGIRLVVAQG